MKVYEFGQADAPAIMLRPSTEIHIFYARKMGEKYRERYLRHFAHPILHEQDMQHEELP